MGKNGLNVCTKLNNKALGDAKFQTSHLAATSILNYPEMDHTFQLSWRPACLPTTEGIMTCKTEG
jgi:hypothetical protein